MDNLVKLSGMGERYFHFYILAEKMRKIEDIILFAIICFLVYIWVKLFLYWDN